jgi:FixJ family two-component response regulator
VDCAVTDLRMPGFDGLKFQDELSKTARHLSLIFITGYGNVPACAKAMKSGAVDFLEMPVDGDALLAGVVRAAERTRGLKAARDEITAIAGHYERLTPRKRQIFGLIVEGSLNKQAASDLASPRKPSRFIAPA